MQITPPRLPQPPAAPRPPAGPTPATIAAVVAALPTPTAGDSLTLSAAARAASDQLIAGQTPDPQPRSPDGGLPQPLPFPPRSDTPGPAVPDPAATARQDAPRWENLLYAPQPLAAPPPRPAPASWPALSGLTKAWLIGGAMGVAILIGAATL